MGLGPRRIRNSREAAHLFLFFFPVALDIVERKTVYIAVRLVSNIEKRRPCGRTGQNGFVPRVAHVLGF